MSSGPALHADATAAVPAQAVTAWASASLCTLEGEAKFDGKQGPLAGHQCPVCWAMQQTASLPPPPTGAPMLLLPVAARISIPFAAHDTILKRVLSSAQPRGPPLV